MAANTAICILKDHIFLLVIFCSSSCACSSLLSYCEGMLGLCAIISCASSIFIVTVPALSISCYVCVLDVVLESSHLHLMVFGQRRVNVNVWARS